MEAARAYYNEIDPAACAVLRQLIADGVIAPGEVDTRWARMTEHVVLRRANEALAELDRRERMALAALGAVRSEKERFRSFLGMYRYLAGEEATDLNFERATNPESDALAPISPPDVQATVGTAQAKQSAEEPLSSGSGEADAVGVEPLPAVASDTSGRPAPALDHPTVKPAGETDGSPAAPSRLERIKAVLTEHPDWTARQIGDELGLHQKHVNAVAEKHELIIRRLTPEEKQQKRIEGARLGGQISRSPAPDPAPEVPVTLKDKIIACNKAHPDWNSHQIAEALDTTPSKVSAYKSCYNIPIPPRAHSSPKFIPATEAPRAQAPAPAPKLIDGLSQARSVLVRQVAEKPASPEPGPASEPQPQPFTVGDQDEEPVHPTVAKFGSPNAKWFRLRRSDGMWLHMSGHGFTVEKKDGWIGKIGQLRAIRGNPRYPDARGLQIIGVTQVAK